jgi:hypothetical protein
VTDDIDPYGVFNQWCDGVLECLEIVTEGMAEEAFGQLSEDVRAAWMGLIDMVPIGVEELTGVQAALMRQKQQKLLVAEAGANFAAEARRIGLEVKQ